VETLRGPSLSRRAVGTVLVLALAGCGSSGQSSSKPPGGHTPFPQVTYGDAGILTAPKVVTITFPGDTMAAQLQSFGQSVASSSWWNAVTVGYCEAKGSGCVGDGPPGIAAMLTEAPAPSYTDSDTGGPSTLQTWLAAAITGGTLPAPDDDPITNTIYVLYFPPTTAITLDGEQSCQNGGFDGYHNSMAMGSQQVVYAVVSECPPLPPETIDTFQATTVTASHEIVESTTDPVFLPPNDPSAYGYYLDFTNPNNWGWIDIEGGEIADLCVDPFNMDQDATGDGAFTVQRIWSNTQAAASLDPCNPIPKGEAYFNAAPRQQVIVVGVGASATIEVDAFSDAPRSAWTLTAQDWSPSPTYLTFSIAGGTVGTITDDAGATYNFPEITVNDGSTVSVTVTLLHDPGSLITGEADGSIISLSGDPSTPTAAHYWPFIVMSPADAADAGISPGTTARHHPPRARRMPRHLPP